MEVISVMEVIGSLFLMVAVVSLIVYGIIRMISTIFWRYYDITDNDE